MFGKKMKICSKCSGVDLSELDEIVGKTNYSVGCIGVCKKNKDMFYGKVNGRILECNTKEELFLQMKEALK